MTHSTIRIWTAAMAVSLAMLTGCASVVTHVATGETTVQNRLKIQVDTAWNQFDHGLTDKVPTWTIEGITVDALKFYVGVQDGKELAPLPSNAKGVTPLIFRASMQPADIVALYQSLLTRDGSSFELLKLEPAEFLGQKGFRFEYALNRKSDDVRMSGLAYGAVRNGELFVIQYSAPRLEFFPRYRTQVERLISSAKLQG